MTHTNRGGRIENFEASTEVIQQIWLQDDSAAINQSRLLGENNEVLRAYYPIGWLRGTWPPHSRALKAEAEAAAKEINIRVFRADNEPSIYEIFQVGPNYMETSISLIRGIALWIPRREGREAENNAKMGTI
jgi:hypothetical protein